MISETEAVLHAHTKAEDDRDWLGQLVYEFMLVGPCKRVSLSADEMTRFLGVWGKSAASPRKDPK